MKIKRYLCSASTKNEYLLIGIWAFTEKGIQRKVNKLAKWGIEIEDRFGNNRFVDKFPEYLSPLHIY